MGNTGSYIKSVAVSACYSLQNITRFRGIMSKQDVEKPMSLVPVDRIIETICKLKKGKKYRNLFVFHREHVTQRIDFKIFLLIHRSIHGSGPKYSSAMLLSWQELDQKTIKHHFVIMPPRPGDRCDKVPSRVPFLCAGAPPLTAGALYIFSALVPQTSRVRHWEIIDG